MYSRHARTPILEYIQGIRTLAMVGIFIAHTAIWLADDLGGFSSISSQLGGSGVVTFFMLSGFLYAYKNAIIPNIAKRSIIQVSWKKVNKMYFLYLITFFVSFIAKFPENRYDWLKLLFSAPFNLTLTQDFVPLPSVVNSFNGPAWFLSAFFGIWIILYSFPGIFNRLMLLTAGKSMKTLLILLLAQIIYFSIMKYGIKPLLSHNHYLAGCYGWLIYNNPFLCLSEYCVGVLIGRYSLQQHISIRMRNVLSLIAFLITAGYMIVLVRGVKVYLPWIVIIELIVCIGIIAVESTETIGNRILSNRVMVWFGNISGYFFLIHGATNYALRSAGVESYISKPWLFFVSFAISLTLSICADRLYSIRKT